MLTVLLLAKIKSGQQQEFETRIAKLFELVRAEPGCRGVTWGPTETPGEYALIERYADQAALEAHRGSKHMKEQAGAQGALFDGTPVIARFTEQGEL